MKSMHVWGVTVWMAGLLEAASPPPRTRDPFPVCSLSPCAPPYPCTPVLPPRCSKCSRHRGVQPGCSHWRKGWPLPDAGSGTGSEPVGQRQVLFANLCNTCNQALKRAGGS